jgi:hypothetical protein
LTVIIYASEYCALFAHNFEFRDAVSILISTKQKKKKIIQDGIRPEAPFGWTGLMKENNQENLDYYQYN